MTDEHTTVASLTGLPQSPLFSTYGMSANSYDNEGRTVDALLWVARHNLGIRTLLMGGTDHLENLHAYVRPVLAVQGKRPTPDAVLVAGDASTLVEAKIGSNKIDLDQCVGYQRAALAYGIAEIVTVSNEEEVVLPAADGLVHRHLSWNEIVAECEWLLAQQDDELLQEWVRYAADDKVGIKWSPYYEDGPAWATMWKQAQSMPDAQRDVMRGAVTELRRVGRR